MYGPELQGQSHGTAVSGLEKLAMRHLDGRVIFDDLAIEGYLGARGQKREMSLPIRIEHDSEDVIVAGVGLAKEHQYSGACRGRRPEACG